MGYEEKVLQKLAEKYRDSKKDSGTNKINRRISIKPEVFYKKYNANDGDFDEITELNRVVEKLAERGFVTVETETFGTQIRCIYLVDAKIMDIEQYLADVYGYVSKDIRLQTVQQIVDKYQNASPTCGKKCVELLASLEKRKLPQNIKKLEDIWRLEKILKAVAFIENNQEDLYIREVSMKVYGTSKYLGEETLKAVCSMICKYTDREYQEDEKLGEILSDYHITMEPQKFCIKGKAVLDIGGVEADISGFTEGVEFRESELNRIRSIKLLTAKFMTIENYTSYLRYHDEDVVAFYLGGYADRYQRDFIKLVSANNPSAHYLHFGDIDAGGLWIHRNLCEITGVDFALFAMSVHELQNTAYASCLQPLTDHDRKRLQELEEDDRYAEVAGYMLEKGVKLEQEIVSLGLMEFI